MELLQPLVTCLAAAGVIRAMWSIRGELSCVKSEFRTWRDAIEKRLEKADL
jgi:hypothetical protein